MPYFYINYDAIDVTLPKKVPPIPPKYKIEINDSVKDSLSKESLDVLESLVEDSDDKVNETLKYKVLPCKDFSFSGNNVLYSASVIDGNVILNRLPTINVVDTSLIPDINTIFDKGVLYIMDEDGKVFSNYNSKD